MDLNQSNINEQAPEKERGYILETIFQGFIILIPLVLILIIFSLVLNFVFGLVEPLSALLDLGKDQPRWWIKLLSLFIFLTIIFGIGVLVRNRKGRHYFKRFERRYLWKIPLYNIAHQTINRFIGMKDLPFSQVVLFDPYNTGVLMTGFVTDKINDELFTIFVPTAPNPMNGNIYHAPKTTLTFLTVSSQEAMRTIMGMGTGSGDMIRGMKIKEEKVKDIIVNPT
jgi:uncharacterized membrane protein